MVTVPEPAVAGLLLLLSGCSVAAPAIEVAAQRGTPVLRAQDGAMATITIIVCPPNAGRALAVGELIETLTMRDELVSARSGGIARLVINACPAGAVAAIGPPPAGRR